MTERLAPRFHERAAELRQGLTIFGEALLAHRQRVIEQAVTGRQHLLVQVVEVHDEALSVELGRDQADLELPRVPVDRHAGTGVPTDVVGKVNVNPCRDLVHVRHIALEPAGQGGPRTLSQPARCGAGSQEIRTVACHSEAFEAAFAC